MLIDLGRNDVGRIAETGSVQVTERMVIERYSHVMHIVSNVHGRIKPKLSAMDALRATFPPAQCPAHRRSAPWRSSMNWNR
jgi:anthranilate synthase component 1